MNKLFIFGIICIILLGTATAIETGAPWLTLDQLAKDASGERDLDEEPDNNIIDNADRVGGLTAAQLISQSSDSDWVEANGNIHRASGNVGIGTTTPALATLQVQSENDYLLYVGKKTGGLDRFAVKRDGTSYFYGGNVGIGTANPASIGDGGEPVIMQIHKASTSGTHGSILELTHAQTGTAYTAGGLVFGSTATASGDKRYSAIYGGPDASSATAPFGYLNFGIWNNGNYGSAMYIDSNRNVGIGRTDPQTKLSIAGNGELFSLNGAGLDGSTYQRGSMYVDTTYGWLFEAPKDANGNRLDMKFSWRGGGDGLTIDGPTGNVGIGTSTPFSTLEVRATGANNAITEVLHLGADHGTQRSVALTLGRGSTSQEAGGNYNARIIGTANAPSNFGSTLQLQTHGTASGVWNPGIFIDNQGKVGIGSTVVSSGLNLDVEGKVGATEFCDENGGNCKDVADLATSDSTGPDNDWTVSGGNVYRGSGNVGIGTTTPGQLLHIRKATGSPNDDVAIRLTENANSWDVFHKANSANLDFKYNDATKMSIQRDGNIGIGTTTPSASLDVNGNMKVGNVFVDPARFSNGQLLFDSQPYIEGEYWPFRGPPDEYVNIQDTSIPFSKVAKSSSYDFMQSDLIPVNAGERLYGEVWVKRDSGATGTAGRFYYGIYRYDKDMKPIAGNAGIEYFVAGGTTIPVNGQWRRHSGYVTLPTSHTPYGGSDGGPVRYVRIILLVNYPTGTIPTYWGGLVLRKVNVLDDAGKVSFNGDVGIATPNPEAKLHITSPSLRPFLVANIASTSNTDDWSAIEYRFGGVPKYHNGIRQDGSQWYVWSTGPGGVGPLIVAKHTGEVGIGTTSPGEKLEVAGTVKANLFRGNLRVEDTRSVNAPPTAYNNEVSFDFKQRNTIGIPGSGSYAGLMTVAPWADNSGDASYQIGFTEGGLYWRQGQPQANSWEGWKAIASEGAKYAGEKHSATVARGRWYRIASNPGSRANAEFVLRDYISGGGHSQLTFDVGISYNDKNGMSFTMRNHHYYSSPTFTKVRVWEGTTYQPMYVEVYVDKAGLVDYSIYNNVHGSGWTPVDWAAGGSPGSGYAAHEYEVNNLFTVGRDDDKFTILRDGNVGIGVPAPARKLEVAGNIRVGGSNRIEFGGTSDYITGGGNQISLATNGAERFNIDSAGVSTLRNRMNFGPGQGAVTWSSANEFILYALSGKKLTLGANNRVRDLIIDTNGNVGIGDTTPDTGSTSGVALKLDVEGAVGATQYCDQNGNNCNTIQGLNSQHPIWKVSGNTLTYTESENIRVGIGTSSVPTTETLLVNGRSLFNNAVVFAGRRGFINTVVGEFNMVAAEDTELWLAAHNRRGDIVIDKEGEVGIGAKNPGTGIGTQVPGRKLDVYDFGTTDREGIRVNRERHSTGLGVDRGGTHWGASIYVDGSKKLTVDSNAGAMIGDNYVGTVAPDDGLIVEGKVGIGTNNPGNNKLEVVGGPIKATGGFIIETRTNDPSNAVDGQMWLRTDIG